MKKYLSYSEIYLWQRDKNEYIERYIKCVPQETNLAMEIGQLLHCTFEDERYPWIKDARTLGLNIKKITALRKILNKMSAVNPPEKEFAIRTAEHDPELFGIFDGFDKQSRVLYEYKTTENPKAWSQWRVDDHFQLSMYAYMYYQIYHAYFTDIQLFVCDTNKGTVKKYHTTRGPKDIQYAGEVIKRVYNELKEAGLWEQRLSREDVLLQNQQPLNLSYAPTPSG